MSHETNPNPLVYLDVTLDGKPCDRIVIEFRAGAERQIAAGVLGFCKDEQKAKQFCMSSAKVFHLSTSLSQEDDPSEEDNIHQKHNDLCFKQPEAYIWPSNTRGSLCVLFTHMHFLNRCYPVQGWAIKGSETLAKIYPSTERIEITNCGEISEDEENYVTESVKGKTGNTEKSAKSSYSDSESDKVENKVNGKRVPVRDKRKYSKEVLVI